MKKWVLSGVCLVLLSGCSSLTAELDQTKADVTQYNQLVAKTIKAHEEQRELALSLNPELLKHVLEIDISSTLPELPKLNAKEKRIFGAYSVVQDDYYTALGSEGVREVMLIRGLKARMYVTAIWQKEKLVSLDRKVVLDRGE